MGSQLSLGQPLIEIDDVAYTQAKEHDASQTLGRMRQAVKLFLFQDSP